jgi:uncharacterized protein (DUF433 family)
MYAPSNAKRKRKSGTEPTFVGEHLMIDARVCRGELAFRNTRVPVETILRYLANGYSLAYLRKSWPEVSAEAIQEAIHLASAQLVEHYRSMKS